MMDSNNPETFDNKRIAEELIKCSEGDDAIRYFIETYVKIYDNDSRRWIPFSLWPAQVDALKVMHENQYSCALKARQVGISWLALSYILWNFNFRPEVLALLFSKREAEAIDLLDYRFKNMYKNLPYWMKAAKVTVDSKTEFAVSNGSRIKASSAGGSDSYAATHCLIDEADLVHNSNTSLQDLLVALEPTVGSAGGKMILVSRAEKSRPMSTFKSIYRASAAGLNEYASIFIPWNARPSRTQEWYDTKKKAALATHGNLDSIYEQYPETAEQALQGTEENKRFSKKIIGRIYEPKFRGEEGVYSGTDLGFSNTVIYQLPSAEGKYLVTVDPAEGNITSDDSVIVVWDLENGEECAMARGKIEEDSLGELATLLAEYYNNAKIFVERNNHGLAVIKYIQLATSGSMVKGKDSTDNRPKYGWKQDAASKPMMWSKAAEIAKENNAIIHTEDMYNQILSIEGSTNRAPEGMNDDLAVNFGLYSVYKKLFLQKVLLASV